MILAVTQARIGSSRLPGKILEKVNDKKMLRIHLERVKRSKLINQIVVATTFEPGVEKIIGVANQLALETFRGSTNNVLERYYQCALQYKPKYIVRITSDCPLIDPELIDDLIKAYLESDYDYASNSLKPTLPDGMDVEIFTFAALETAFKNATSPEDLEHVTPYIWRNSTFFKGTIFKSLSYENKTDYSQYRLTLDTPDDLKNLTVLIKKVGDDKSWMDYINFIEKNPSLFSNVTVHV